MKIYEGSSKRFIISETMENVAEICERKDADGFILAQAPLKMKVYHRNGSENRLCVHGLRCFIQYSFDLGLIQESTFQIETSSGMILANIQSIQPFVCELLLPLPTVQHHFVELGSCHQILFNRLFENGPRISQKHKCSVNYVQVRNPHHLSVVTYEKEMGFTQTCGSGAVASAYYAFLQHLCAAKVEVIHQGGNLLLEFKEQISVIGSSRCLSKSG